MASGVLPILDIWASWCPQTHPITKESKIKAPIRTLLLFSETIFCFSWVAIRLNMITQWQPYDKQSKEFSIFNLKFLIKYEFLILKHIQR